jgi:hypothetical protein
MNRPKSNLPKLPLRDFSAVLQELEDTVSQLKAASNQKTRVRLLYRLRVLIEEAEIIIESET